MINKIIEIIEEELDTNGKVITENTKIVEDLGADSLDKAEIMIAIQEEFNISVNEEEIAKISTLKDIVDYINKNGK